MNGAQAVIKTLADKGVKQIYGYPGGSVLPLYDALLESDRIKHILVRNEQASAHAASGQSRTGDVVGVCLSTSGPGATNLVTGIATAYMDSIPMIIITGQVATNLIGTDAFQEVDITGITLPIVKHSYLVKEANELPQIIEDAFHIANTGRKGPVLIDIPKDIQLTEIDYIAPKPAQLKSYKPNVTAHHKQVKKVAESIAKAKKPLFFIGGGMVSSGAAQQFNTLLERIKVPVASTLMGLGAVASKNPYFIGMVGLHGSPTTNYAIQHCDLLINLGARFDDRSTIVVETFAPNATICHVDIDPAEIGKNILVEIPVVADLKIFIEELSKIAKDMEFASWLEEIRGMQRRYPITYKRDGNLKPQYIIQRLYELTEGDAYVTTDVGQHQMWTAQYYRFNEPGKFITSGGLGTMGYGLPAAIGIKANHPNKTVVCVTGDGSFQMNFHEIATALEQGMDIKILLLNNDTLSLVRQLQYFSSDKRYSGVDFTANPDFVRLVKAYPNTEAYAIYSMDDVDHVLEKALNNGKLTLIDCHVSNQELVYPVASPKVGLNAMQYLDDETISLN